MGSKVKGWHSKSPKGEKRRMYEETSGRKPKIRTDRDRKQGRDNRVDYSRFVDQDQ